MTDLTAALADIRTDSSPHFKPDGGEWTPDRLAGTLRTWGIAYCEHQDKLDISPCPLCGETEGNPAAWVHNGYPVFKCLRSNKCNATWSDLESKYAKRLPRYSAVDLPDMFPNSRPDVIEHLLRRGDVCGIVGGPKTHKSFWMMQVAMSVAAGVPFLGWQTVQGRVLILDNELRPDDWVRRAMTMAKALGLEWDKVARYIDVMPLRGKQADLYSIRDELAREPNRYVLAIVDALYKAMPRNLEENSNSDMTSALVLLDECAERHDCALAFAHHLSKGNQQNKSVTDLGSGAGAQSRSVDVHLAMLPHEDDGTVVLRGVLRSQPPFAPLCLTFEYPIWRVAKDKNPELLAGPPKKPVPTLEAFLALIPTTAAPKTTILAAAKRNLCTSRVAINALLDESISRGLVETDRPKNRQLPATIRKLAA